MKLTKYVWITLLLISIIGGGYLCGIGCETKYYITNLESGEYGWIKKSGGYSYQSQYQYDTYGEAANAAGLHRDYGNSNEIILETPLEKKKKDTPD